ncbi:MAG TPA: DUF1573 domain-containing protein [Candidatus Acidoferrum sp.]|nr:DUF1573 domain-containing protein [Candidatus Acidoferrum sp.]
MTKRNLILAFIIGMGAMPAPARQPAAPAAVPQAGAGANPAGPKIQFATPVYDFGRVKAGEPVKYSFVFTNTGDQVLEVKAVQPSCGCTTAGDWTRVVKAGETGNVPVQFNSANFNGPVFKTVTVTSNDRTTPTVVLQLKGSVWKPIEYVPPYTVLNILPDSPTASAVIRIINNTDGPLTLSDPECNTKAFTARLTTTQPGKEYQLTLEAVPPLTPGSIQGKVTLKTSLADLASIEVPFWANVQQPVIVMPPQITLPQNPLTTRATPAVTIQNNSTNAMVLSDLAVNVPGVEVQLRELSPGKTFNISFTFPEGFTIPPGQQVAFTAKSSNPRLPLINVPIVQMPRTVPPPQPAGVPAATLPPAVRPAPLLPTAQAAHPDR